jgi:multidrug efflux pump subunit AcrB
MNIAEFSIRKNVITLMFTVLMLVAGVQSFMNLSRLEDPEFTIKTAQVITPYPGAAAVEVEQEVSDLIEKAAQELEQLKFVESQSMRGLSIVRVEIKDKYDKTELPQVWDELRRKVNDYQGQLPPGAGPSLVNDDFGDVYGIMFSVSGDDYSYREIKDFIDMLKRELVMVQDVKRVDFFGDQPEVIYVQMKRQKMAGLGITQEEIYQALSDKNLVHQAGMIKIGSEYIPINPTGEFTSEEQFGDLLISRSGTGQLIYLKDVADIERGYADPPQSILRVNGKNAIGVIISTVSGGNVVNMGKALVKRMWELAEQAPLGMEVTPIYIQAEKVTESIKGFMVNLVEAVVIVVVLLLFFMGIKSGLIIGFILLLTICGTFIGMNMRDVILQRISLGALIIALGMLVDNAIVVVEGMKVKMEQGTEAVKAAKDIVGQTALPLLGATLVAILAFAAIGVSQDSTGEYCRSLFQVMLISLLISWVTAVTTTPLLCKMFFKSKTVKGGAAENVDPYAGKMFRMYRDLLRFCLKNRLLTVGSVLILFLISLVGFKFVKRSFFPNSSAPHFLVDIWYPEGSHINVLAEDLKRVEKYFIDTEGVANVALYIGGGFPRFMLTYSPENPSRNYAQFLITVDDYKKIDDLISRVESDFPLLLPDAVIGAKKFLLGPGDGGKIQLRIMGPEIDELRRMADQAKMVMIEDGGAKTIRDEWREKVKVVRPQFTEAQTRRTGITRAQLSQKMESAFSGIRTGVYREDTDLIPIMARAPAEERWNVDNINDLGIWSPAASKAVPVRQIISGFATEFEDANIWRRNRMRMIRIHADPKKGLASEVLVRVKPGIERALNVNVGSVIGGEVEADKMTDKTLPVEYMMQMPLKGAPQYSIGWDGEIEDSTKGQTAIRKNLPIFFILMVVIVVCLFNSVVQPVIIWLTVPLALIGVTFGLLLFDGAFGFMALLGLLSLSGMLIKNAIVLIDQIDLEIRSGKDPYYSIVDSGVSRLRPVSMAAGTTILGMAPLLTDAFFADMAITIMSGLGFATFLTLLFVPVLYSIFFNIKYHE